MNTIHSISPSWTRSVSSHDQVIQWTKAKVHVYSDSVLCLVKSMSCGACMGDELWWVRPATRVYCNIHP